MTQYHFVMSAAQGGQTGKSTLILMLASHLIETDPFGTVIIIDITEVADAPPLDGKQSGIAVYDCLLNILGFRKNDLAKSELYVAGSRFIVAPAQSHVNNINLIAVKADGQEIDSWDEQIAHVKEVQNELNRKGFNASHVIVETNLQPNAPGIRNVLRGEQLGHRPLYMWTCWRRPALRAWGLINDLTFLQKQFNGPHWYFVHNPYDDIDGRDSQNEMASMKKLHQAPYHPSSNVAPSIGKRADQAIELGLTGNGYWDYVYQEYLTQNRRPRNLFPIYRRSDAFHNRMSNQFEGEGSIDFAQELPNYLERASDGLYSNIYAPLFSRIE